MDTNECFLLEMYDFKRQPRISISERFWSGVMIRSKNECWPWSRSCHRKGYGQFAIGRKKIETHRVAWILSNGKIEGELCVLHKCDNPPCCNPSHLFLGTLADNNKDMMEKGRQARGEKLGSRIRANAATGLRNGWHTCPEKRRQGEQVKVAKLTTLDILEIRKRYAQGNVTQTQLAKEYGVHVPTVHRIVRHKHWKHI